MIGCCGDRTSDGERRDNGASDELLHDDFFTFVGGGSIGVPKSSRGGGEIGWNIDEDATCKQKACGSNDTGS